MIWWTVSSYTTGRASCRNTRSITVCGSRDALFAATTWKTRAKNGENACLWWVNSVAKRECDRSTKRMRPAPTRMIGWCLCNTAAATVSWASVDLDGFLEQTASGDWFRRAGRRAGGKWQHARCSRKTQDKFAITFIAKKLLHRCISAHARVHMNFCGERECTHRCCWALWMCRCVC